MFHDRRINLRRASDSAPARLAGYVVFVLALGLMQIKCPSQRRTETAVHNVAESTDQCEDQVKRLFIDRSGMVGL